VVLVALVVDVEQVHAGLLRDQLAVDRVLERPRLVEEQFRIVLVAEHLRAAAGQV
jgi:hypothetical protein